LSYNIQIDEKIRKQVYRVSGFLVERFAKRSTHAGMTGLRFLAITVNNQGDSEEDNRDGEPGKEGGPKGRADVEGVGSG
jgi:hypothetical protein